MKIEELYKIYLQSRLVSTDSRKISPGSIFFALKGENFNGNQFALQAIEQGSLAAIVDEEPATTHTGIYRVDDVLTTLQKLAAFHRKQIGIPILAITGSNGKTTTKELCKAVLSKKFNVYATTGNLNNHIGVPLTLLAMNDQVELGIVEMGANHPGEIRNLCAIACPDMGVITNVGKAHLEGFGSLEGVALAKGELFEHLRANHKTIFINDGNEYVRKLVPDSYTPVIHYNSESGARVINKKSNPFLELDINVSNQNYLLKTNLLGGYNAENVLAAFCVGTHMGVAPGDIKDAIESYKPQNNRSQFIESGKNRLFMDAYNANPSSMIAAVDEFLLTGEDKKLLILGEMREVGDSSYKEHKALIDHMKEKNVELAICIGKSFEKVIAGTGYTYFETVEQLIGYLKDRPLAGHYILIKGSRANKLENLLQVL
jgi:UDP-N-acetylmuramoyl-tripeptide--D-alanyl-D-alanine ligase